MARITKERLDRRRKLVAEKLDLDRRSRALETEIKQIDSDAAADLKATGKDSVRRGGYLLTWKDGRPSIQWKSEFVRIAGAEAANRITADAPRPKKLDIVAPVPVG